MNFDVIVLRKDDADTVLAFEKERLAEAVPDEIEREFASWNARWRPEALEHYLSSGWCFGVWSREGQSQLLGYFLAQPILFFRGMTQTLWVEHVAYSTQEVGRHLVEVAYRMARDKHMQKVLFMDHAKLEFALEPWKPTALLDDIAEVKSSKVQDN